MPYKKVSLVLINMKDLENLELSRREMIQCAIRLVLDSVQMLFSQTYVCVTFLIMFATIWTFDIRFDTQFFAVASCMLGYIEISVLDFGTGIHGLAQYISAEKRIQVSASAFFVDKMFLV
jgi:hypothetical protein